MEKTTKEKILIIVKKILMYLALVCMAINIALLIIGFLLIVGFI